MRAVLLLLALGGTGCQLVFPLDDEAEPKNAPRGCSPISMLAADFNDGVVRPPFVLGGAAIIGPTSGVIRAVGPASLDGALLTAEHYFELRGQQFSVKTSPIGDLQNAVITLELEAETGEVLVWSIEGEDDTSLPGNLIALRIENGVLKQVGSMPYLENEHRYLRIAHDGDDLTTWEVSPDGLTYTTAFELPGLPWVGFMKPTMRMTSPLALTVEWDDINGPDPVGEACPADSLRDDFETGAIGQIWSSAVIQDCELEIVDGAVVATWHEDDTLSDTCILQSSTVYNLRDNKVFVELGEHTLDPSNGTAFLAIHTLEGRTAVFARFADQLGAFDDVSMAPFEQLAYDPAVHRFLKLSATEDDVLLWEVSEDGNAFQPFAQAPAGSLGPLDAVAILFGIDGETLVPAFATFDNFNRR